MLISPILRESSFSTFGILVGVSRGWGAWTGAWTWGEVSCVELRKWWDGFSGGVSESDK